MSNFDIQYWYEAEKYGLKAHELLWSTYKDYQAAAQRRITSMMRNYDLFRGIRPREIYDIDPNFARAHMESWIADMLDNRILPMVITDMAKPKTIVAARTANLWGQGLFYENNIWEKQVSMVTDMGVAGTTFVLGEIDSYGKICNRVIKPTDVFLDEREWRTGDGRWIIIRHTISRRRLKKIFRDDPAIVEGLDRCSAVEDEETPGVYAIAYPDFKTVVNRQDLVTCIEAWHLESAPGAGDGRYCFIGEAVTMIDKPFESKKIPVRHARAFPDDLGFWGLGVFDKLRECQEWITKMSANSVQAMSLASKINFYTGYKNEVSVDDMSNPDVRLVKSKNGVDDIKPLIMPAGNPEVNKFIYDIFPNQIMNTLAGTNPQPMGESIPAGMTAARAVAMVLKETSGRHIVPRRATEKLMCDIFDMNMDLTRDLADIDPDFTIRLVNKGKLLAIKAVEAVLEEDTYRVATLPTNALARSGAQRVQQVEYLIQNGDLPKEQRLNFLGFADIQNFFEDANAEKESILMAIQKILDGEEFMPPLPGSDFLYAYKEAKAQFDKTLQYTDKRYESIRSNLLNYMDSCMESQTEMMNQLQAMQGPPPGAGGPPPGAPSPQGA